MEDELITPLAPEFFCFPDEATGLTALDAAGFINENGEFITASHDHALDVLGVIIRGGELDDEGDVTTSPKVVNRWHVNFRGEVPDEWKQYAVHPQNPVRIWL